MVKHFTTFGFTLIELLVVISIMAIVGGIALFGLGSYRNTQPLINAQAEFLVELRALQNQAINGADAQTFKTLWVYNTTVSGHDNQHYYFSDSSAADPNTTVGFALPAGVTISQNTAQNAVALCFASPSKGQYSDRTTSGVFDRCGSCTGSPGGTSYTAFACSMGSGTSSPIGGTLTSIVFTLSLGSDTRTVVVDGSGMRINSIHAQ